MLVLQVLLLLWVSLTQASLLYEDDSHAQVVSPQLGDIPHTEAYHFGTHTLVPGKEITNTHVFHIKRTKGDKKCLTNYEVPLNKRNKFVYLIEDGYNAEHPCTFVEQTRKLQSQGALGVIIIGSRCACSTAPTHNQHPLFYDKYCSGQNCLAKEVVMFEEVPTTPKIHIPVMHVSKWVGTRMADCYHTFHGDISEPST